MTYHFARINLGQTDYQTSVDWQYLEPTDEVCIALDNIYRKYCMHKRFASVMPMFWSRYRDPMSDVIGYYDAGKLVAWSLVRRYDNKNALCDQFAWTYHCPRLRMGIETMKTECAIYKQRGFDFLYLEQAHIYKKEISGFELLGPMS